MKNISVAKIVKDLISSDFYLSLGIPLGYTAGFPVLRIVNSCLCITIPYLRYQITGEVDKTLIYPIRYGITLELPTLKVVGFENYEYISVFKNIQFDKPVGFFRHDAIKQYNKHEYKAMRQKLNECYDKVIQMILGEIPYDASVDEEMASLLRLLVEPSIMPMYRALDPDFYNKYIEEV